MRIIGTVLAAIVAALVATTAATTAAAQSDYRLDTGDLLEIHLVEQGRTGAPQRVDNAGDVFVPLLGKLSVSGLTTDALARAIEDAYRRAGVYVEPRVAVSLVEGRPYIVAGDVKASGSYPSRPNLTVAGAVAIAGGPSIGLADRPRTPEERARLTAELVEIRTDLFAARLGILRRRSEIARIDEIPQDGLDPKGVPDAFVARRIEDETRLLRASNALLVREQANVASQLKVLTAEIEATGKLREQFERLTTRLEEALATREELETRGLALRSTTLSSARELAAVIAQLSTQELNAFRFERTRIELEERRLAVVSERESRLLVEIADLDASLVKLIAREAAALGLLAAPDARAGAVEISYAITRRVDGVMQTLEATALDPVAPGDLVIVETRLDLGS